MDKRHEIYNNWREAFPGDSPEWIEAFFDSAYSDDVAMTLHNDDGSLLSSLLLLPYSLRYFGREVGLSYICGAATRRIARGQGCMSRLITEALQNSASRGDMMCSLIPADQRLYGFYSRFGFAPVFFNRVYNYPRAYGFQITGSYTDVADSLSDDSLYQAFVRLESRMECCVTHSMRQLRMIQRDNTLSDGVFVALRDDMTDAIAALAWAVPDTLDPASLRIVCLLSESDDAANAAMQRLQQRRPSCRLTLLGTPYGESPLRLKSFAMGRIVRADNALSVLAATHPELKATIKIIDPLIEDNNRIFQLADGQLLPNAAPSRATVDLDITIATLTAILFGSPAMGKIMGLPARRPYMSLMLN